MSTEESNQEILQVVQGAVNISFSDVGVRFYLASVIYIYKSPNTTKNEHVHFDLKTTVT